MNGFDLLGADTAPSLADVRAGNGVIKKGMTGDSVMYVQGIAGAVADGDFGSATETAVKNFQSAHGLSVDGVVGQATMAALDALAGGATAGVSKIDFSKPSSKSNSFASSSPAYGSPTTLASVKTSTSPSKSWWTQPSSPGGLARWKIVLAAGGGALGLFGLLVFILSGGRTVPAVKK